jgi:hypothetical protein
MSNTTISARKPCKQERTKEPNLGEWEVELPCYQRGGQEMGDLGTPTAHPPAVNPNAILPNDKGRKEGANENSTPKVKLIFDLLRRCEGATQRKWVDANPFEALNGEDDASNFLRKALEALEGGWIFQGKKKHKVKIDPTCPKVSHHPCSQHH